MSSEVETSLNSKEFLGQGTNHKNQGIFLLPGVTLSESRDISELFSEMR